MQMPGQGQNPCNNLGAASPSHSQYTTSTNVSNMNVNVNANSVQATPGVTPGPWSPDVLAAQLQPPGTEHFYRFKSR